MKTHRHCFIASEIDFKKISIESTNYVTTCRDTHRLMAGNMQTSVSHNSPQELEALYSEIQNVQGEYNEIHQVFVAEQVQTLYTCFSSTGRDFMC